jgi:signal transduction histidine kinase
MNRLWIRISLAFAIVLIISFLLTGYIVQQNIANPDIPPPPEVIAYFQELRRASRVVPNPLSALAIITGMAIVAGAIVGRWVASPMSDLEKAANEIGQGELGVRLDPRGSQEMVAVAAAFNDMAEQLQKSESLRQSLLADVAHELRHPLHVLQGNLQAMQDGVYPINEEEIDRLLNQTHHLTVMVDDLYVLAQAEARRLPLQTQEVDIAELVKDVAAAYQPAAMSQNIDLHVELLGTLPSTIVIDKARIRQTVQNLLENALRHTGKDGRIKVIIQLRDNAELRIEVKDTGEGIPEDQLPLIFDRLYRADSARQRSDGSSTGLGLAISQAIVEAHGGTITVRSPGIGRGSAFTIELPI